MGGEVEVVVMEGPVWRLLPHELLIGFELSMRRVQKMSSIAKSLVVVVTLAS